MLRMFSNPADQLTPYWGVSLFGISTLATSERGMEVPADLVNGDRKVGRCAPTSTHG